MICRYSASSPTMHPWSPMSLSRLREGLPSTSKAFREHMSISSRLCMWVKGEIKKKNCEFIGIFYTKRKSEERKGHYLTLNRLSLFTISPSFRQPLLLALSRDSQSLFRTDSFNKFMFKVLSLISDMMRIKADTQMRLVDPLNSDLDVQQSTCKMEHWCGISISVLKCQKNWSNLKNPNGD